MARNGFEGPPVEFPNWYVVDIGFGAIELSVRALTEQMAQLKAVYWCDENSFFRLPADAMFPIFVEAKPMDPIRSSANDKMGLIAPSVSLISERQSLPPYNAPIEYPVPTFPKRLAMFEMDDRGRTEYPYSHE